MAASSIRHGGATPTGRHGAWRTPASSSEAPDGFRPHEREGRTTNLFKRPLPPEKIVDAYRRVFLREPDAKEIAWRRSQRLDCEQLYATLLESEEFGLRGGDVLETLGRMYVANARIDADVEDRATLERLLERVVGQWRRIGESETFWSVRPDEGFKKDTLDQARIDDMYASGYFVRGLIEAFETKAKAGIPRGRCFELGCGVGRETHVLAQMFDSVLATEISTGALRVCEAYLAEKGIRNVDLKQMTAFEDFRADGPYDLFYSSAVLEHSPPPVQKEILRASLAYLKPGGFCIFNTPAYIHDYRFAVDDYLASKDEVFELHCLPTAETLRVLNEMDIEIVDFVPDGVLAQFGSMMYFGRKRAAER